MRGQLNCDFSARKSQRRMMVLSPGKFQTILSQLGSPTFSDRKRLELVQMLAPFTFLTCK